MDRRTAYSPITTRLNPLTVDVRSDQQKRNQSNRTEHRHDPRGNAFHVLRRDCARGRHDENALRSSGWRSNSTTSFMKVHSSVLVEIYHSQRLLWSRPRRGEVAGQSHEAPPFDRSCSPAPQNRRMAPTLLGFFTGERNLFHRSIISESGVVHAPVHRLSRKKVRGKISLAIPVSPSASWTSGFCATLALIAAARRPW